MEKMNFKNDLQKKIMYFSNEGDIWGGHTSNTPIKPTIHPSSGKYSKDKSKEADERH